MVAAAWLDRDDAGEILAAHAEFDFVRGIRNKPSAAHAPYAPAPGPRGSMSDPAWRRGYALLERHGFSFELQVAHWHLPEAASLARDFPGVQIILHPTTVAPNRLGRSDSTGELGVTPSFAVRFNQIDLINTVGNQAVLGRWSDIGSQDRGGLHLKRK